MWQSGKGPTVSVGLVVGALAWYHMSQLITHTGNPVFPCSAASVHAIEKMSKDTHSIFYNCKATDTSSLYAPQKYNGKVLMFLH